MGQRNRQAAALGSGPSLVHFNPEGIAKVERAQGVERRGVAEGLGSRRAASVKRSGRREGAKGVEEAGAEEEAP